MHLSDKNKQIHISISIYQLITLLIQIQIPPKRPNLIFQREFGTILTKIKIENSNLFLSIYINIKSDTKHNNSNNYYYIIVITIIIILIMIERNIFSVVV